MPEKREELTTEGGLDVVGQRSRVRDAVNRLAAAGIEVSLFIDPEQNQIEAAKEVGAPVIEIHTGAFADATTPEQELAELGRIQQGVKWGLDNQLVVNAGHGLHYHNVEPVAAIEGINELNIGHGLMARAMFVGMKQAVQEMLALMLRASR